MARLGLFVVMLIDTGGNVIAVCLLLVKTTVVSRLVDFLRHPTSVITTRYLVAVKSANSPPQLQYLRNSVSDKGATIDDVPRSAWRTPWRP